MKAIKTICLLAVVALSGCSKMEECPDCGGGENVRITLSAEADGHTVVSRSTDENGIYDLNIYLFNNDQPGDYHFYATGSDIHIEVKRNRYDVYVIANHGSDMGQRSKNYLSSLTFTAEESPQRLPMSYEGTLTVTRPADFTLQLTRALAKVDFEVTVAPGADNIELRSVQLVNVPMFGNYFSRAYSWGYAERTITPTAMTDKSFSASFYLPENKQGTVATITTQQMKNRDNAPQYATFLLVRAEKSGRRLDYIIMLGENNTSDFNVLRNHNYKVDVEIRSDAEADLRITSYTVAFRKVLSSPYLNSFSASASQFTISPWPLPEHQFTIRAEVISGDDEFISVVQNGNDIIGADVPASVLSSGSFSTSIRYGASLFTAINQNVQIKYTLKDQYGREFIFYDNWLGVNVLEVVTKWSNVASNIEVQYSGGYTTSTTITADMRNRWMSSYFNEYGVRVTATPNEGYLFGGWYLDAACTQLYSADPVLDYVPQQSTLRLWMKEIINE